MLVTGVAGLEAWCRQVTQGYPGVNMAQQTNFASAWRDGLAFCALIHRFRPDLIDFSDLKPGQAQRNCQIAFSVAESQLEIPSLLDSGDMTESSQLDRRSLLTYLAQFYHKFATHPASLSPSRQLQQLQQLQQFSKTEINSPQSLPTTLNSAAVSVRDKAAPSSGSNVAAIKELVFNTRAQPQPQGSEPTGSDSGLEQEGSGGSSSASSRLSSVSPSFNKNNNTRDLDQNTPSAPVSGDKLKSRKYPANMIIKPKRTHISVNNRIDQNRSSKSSQGRRNNAASFQEAFIKFNSLSLESGGDRPSELVSLPEVGETNNNVQRAEIKQLRSQSSQTEPAPPPPPATSQHSQTEQRHIRPRQDWQLRLMNQSTHYYQHHQHHQHHDNRNCNYNYAFMSSGLPVYSTLV